MTEIMELPPDLVEQMVDYITPSVLVVWKASKVYLFWISVHFAIANGYYLVCAPTSVSGFFMSPFLVSSPHCRALRWANEQSALTVDNMWIVFGTWMASKITSFF